MICYSRSSRRQSRSVRRPQNARESVPGLRALLERLPPSTTPKLLIFVSEGLVTGQRKSQLAWLAARAAEAHVTLYALHLMPPNTTPHEEGPPTTYMADRALLEEGLALMAGVTRGDVFRVMANSDFAFRVFLELSGYYLLRFEPEVVDRNGRPHEIKVDCSPAGCHRSIAPPVHHRPDVLKSGAINITALLRDPLPSSDIPIKVTTYSFRETHSDRIRLLIAAEVDRAPTTAGDLSLGYVLVDFDRRLAASQLDEELQADCAAWRSLSALFQHGGHRTRPLHAEAGGRGRRRAGAAPSSASCAPN